MNKIFPGFSRTSLALWVGVFSLPVWAADIIALDVASLPGDKTEIKVSFNEPPAAPQSYTIDQPARIAIDLEGTKNRLGQRSRELGAGNARSITLVEAGERTRMIVNLTNPAPYSTRVEGNNLFVTVGDSSAGNAPSSPASTTTTSAAPSQAATSARSTSKQLINNIDFQRGEQGEGNVIIELSNASVNADIREQGNKIRLNFAGTELPEKLRARLDVKDFATPVQYVAASGSRGGSSIVIEPTGNYEYMVYQVGNQLTVSIKPQTKEERQRADTPLYKGEKLSLNFQDIEVRSVLQLIADFTELNLVASDAVQGSITLRLQNVPWDQALDLVLRTKGLDKRLVGNVLMVDLAEGIAERERQELEARKQIAELAPLYHELIQVNYAKADKIAELFKSAANTSGNNRDERGSVTVDDRTNSIIAYQTQDKLDELRRIVAQLDIPVKQVMIEARIVEANEDFAKSLGVKWGGTSNSSPTGLTSGGYVNSIAGGLNEGAFVDLGTVSPTSSIAFGYLKNNLTLNLELTAMQKSGYGEIISQPKVMTANQQTAKVMKGEEVPYQEQTGGNAGGSSTSFKEALLSLEVTPQITPDNRVGMEVKITKDRVDRTAGAAVGGVPPILKQEVSANVLVADGETVVIGGVFEGEKTKGIDKVPFLGDLPFIGRLFKRDTVDNKKRELLVFITPRILTDHGVAASVLP
ncbi:fimbrial protein [Ventosimonas gracilis]|uniref:Fimbrial protein n=1 Tax=Ventosimonas gracilis TaxID=1680762 RepID=A0A139SSY0_9GAMM|nr:type IV pilus secretin PilQ [Ventosimonas gracilis]KXU37560.1 fimbrial protein [Ventosimonas gracilis]